MSAPRFHPHFNSATGKYHGSEKDYNKTLKEMNLVPYEKPKEKAQPVYKASPWAREMVNQIKRGNVGSVFKDELKKKGYDLDKMKNANEQARRMGLKDQRSGGFK